MQYCMKPDRREAVEFLNASPSEIRRKIEAGERLTIEEGKAAESLAMYVPPESRPEPPPVEPDERARLEALAVDEQEPEPDPLEPSHDALHFKPSDIVRRVAALEAWAENFYTEVHKATNAPLPKPPTMT